MIASASTLDARRQVRNFLKAASMRLFLLGDRVGLHITPKHYYAANHDVSWLRGHQELWARPIDFHNLHWDLDEQLQWLQSVVSPTVTEVEGLDVFRTVSDAHPGPGFGPIESQVLHSFVRWAKPRRVVELGAGVSSLAMLHADGLNQAEGQAAMSLTCIDPHPWPGIDGVEGLTLLPELAQGVDIATFDMLQAGDLLFIDSSHAVKVGSEVPRIYLEIIPRLVPGVYIHIHDIYFPFLYAPDVLVSYLAWQESTLLLALLTNNPKLEVLACLSALHHDRTESLSELLPDYNPRRLQDGLMMDTDTRSHFPSSIYLVTK